VSTKPISGLRLNYVLVLVCVIFAACSSKNVQPQQTIVEDIRVQSLQPKLLLLGEQHDAPNHPRLHAQAVQDLASQGRLAALVLEMVDQYAGADKLRSNATEEQVQTALRWREDAWPWANYKGAVMAAVRAGAPVVGAGLSQPNIKQAMQSAAYDGYFTPALWQRQLDAIRTGHCDMLPASQLPPMARVQVARDLAMARAMLEQMNYPSAQGKTVVLIAGSGHVDAQLAVPFHISRISPSAVMQITQWPQEATGTDYCAQFKQQMQKMGKPTLGN
jgi:uncharacterized iron-regulated protein